MIRYLLLIPMLATWLAAGPLYWQPVIDYTMSFPGDRSDAAPIINPFENFTHLASDFGWMGPGEHRIDAKGGIIRVKPGEGWTGAWQSLAGLASQPHRLFNPEDVVGLEDDPKKAARVREISINASGKGLMHLEFARADRHVLWRQSLQLNRETTSNYRVAVDLSALGKVKFLHWVVEPETEIQLSSIGFMVERPAMTLEEWAFRISLSKLRRCHDPESGLTRDRGHMPAGHFDTIASTGMHALASAAGVAEGMIERDVVLREVENTVRAIEALPKAGGVLPHFLHRVEGGRITLVAGTEFSTVDSAIALHGLLLATRMLGDVQLQKRVEALIMAINFDAVTDAEGWISHGYLDDGQTLLKPSWRDWGGETALVLCLEAMIEGRRPRGRMSDTGEPYRGVGFIAEIQSLFYPDFDRKEPDLVSGMVWPDIRKKLLKEQMGYFRQQWPDSQAAKKGIFGISAGEAAMPGAGYSADGVEVMGVRWIHPHYMLMGAGLNDAEIYADCLQRLDALQLLQPMGLPENMEIDLRLHNPMAGSLNASFEALAAYHGWKKRLTPSNRIDQASMQDPLARRGAARFYPPAP